MAVMTRCEVLTGDLVDPRAEDLGRDLDDALSARPDAGVTPLSDRELGFLAEDGGPGVAEALRRDDSDRGGRERTRRVTDRLIEAIGGSLTMSTPQPELEDQTPVAYLAGGGGPTLVAAVVPGLTRRRTHPFTVRLSAEEYVALQRVADARHLPASTLARAWLLDRINANERAS